MTSLISSRILAAALSECLPGLTIRDVGVAWNGFYCDFSFSQPFNTEILIQLEERIRQIVREKRAVRMMEMVPVSASEWLKKNGQAHRASQVLSQKGYISLIQIGSFVDSCEEVSSQHTGEAGIFRLLDKKNLGKTSYRIFGVSAPSKEALKHKIQLYQQFPRVDHEMRGVKLGLWEMVGQERIWLGSGLEARRNLIQKWRENFSTIALEVECNEALIPQFAQKRNAALMQMTRLPMSGAHLRGLMDAPQQLAMQIKTFETTDISCISFLQTVHKSLTILGFTYRIRLLGSKRKKSGLDAALEHLGWKVDERMVSDESRIEFLVADEMECEWAVATLVKSRPKGDLCLTVWIERNLALLLEKDVGLLKQS